jgi:pimeloyl-ACP methyl ester carboxylesterase
MSTHDEEEAMTAPARSIDLEDGRTLCFAEHGDPAGHPVLWLHGAASSRLEAAFFDDGARDRGLRIISTDRPGCGGSSALPGYTFLSYATDLVELQGALGIDACPVGGFSNGGAFSLAAGQRFPDRFPAVITVNGTTPVADPAVSAVLPEITRLAYRNMRELSDADIERTVLEPAPAPVPSTSPPSDYELEMQIIAEHFAAASAEARRQPTSGYIVRDVRLAHESWGFDHRSLRQPVEVVTGDQDAGYAYAQVLATELADARLTVFAGGHAGIAVEPGISAVVDALARAVQATLASSRR